MNGTCHRLKCNCFQVNEFVFIFQMIFILSLWGSHHSCPAERRRWWNVSFLWCPWGVDVGGDVGNWPVRAAEYTGASYGSTSPISTERICCIENMSTATGIYWTGNSTLNVFSPTRTLSSSSGSCKKRGIVWALNLWGQKRWIAICIIEDCLKCILLRCDNSLCSFCHQFFWGGFASQPHRSLR